MSEVTVRNKNDGAEANSRKGWLATGGVLGALLASSCCIVPLVLISLGVSGAWIGSLTALEPYKPIFIGVAVIFLAGGFWQVYFKKPEPCEDGTICARPETSRMTKAALWIATILILLALTIDYWAPLFYLKETIMKKTLLLAAAIAATAIGGLALATMSQSANEETVVASAEETQATAQFAIEKMTCATCPISVRKAMNRVDGVKSVEVDFETKVATVVYDPALTTTADIAAASTNVGYPATEIEA